MNQDLGLALGWALALAVGIQGLALSKAVMRRIEVSACENSLDTAGGSEAKEGAIGVFNVIGKSSR